ncbi:MAG: PaaI family thioesterase [Limisphaerales bacterium]
MGSCTFTFAESCAKWQVFNVQQQLCPDGTAVALLNAMTNSSAPDGIQTHFRSTQAEAHPFCFVCSGSNPMGLALRYTPQPDGSVSANFLGHCALEGYPGLLHGGVIAALLDGAMTNCLFARGIRGLTVELWVRYHAGVVGAEESLLRAWVEDESHGLFQLRAKLSQGGKVKASATGKFMKPA